jgi:hypothetical protein
MKSSFDGLKRGRLLVVCAGLGACVDFGSDTPPFGGGVVDVRAVNAATPTFDLLHDGTVVTSGVAFGESSSCVTAELPSHGLAFRYGNLVLPLTASFAAGETALVFATTHSRPGGGGTVHQFLPVYGFDFAQVGGPAKLVIVNASGDSYDVHVTSPGAPIPAPTFWAIASGHVSSAMSLAAESHQIRVTALGSSTVVHDGGTRVFAAGERVVFVISPPAPTTTEVRSFFQTLVDC